MTPRFHTSTAEDGAITVAAVGDIDMAFAGPFRETLVRAGAEGGRLVVDLTGVDYLDSAGIRVLYEQAASHPVALLVKPGSAAAVALEISGLTDVVPVQHPQS